MSTVLLIVHLMIAAGLTGLVLLQRSEGGALGMGGGTGSLISGRGAADALAKMTMVAGALFLLTSISLTVLAGYNERQLENSIVLDQPSAPSPRRVVPAPQPIPAPTPGPEAGAETAALDAAVAPAPDEAVERAGPVERAPPPPVRAAAVTPPPAQTQQRAPAPLPRAPAVKQQQTTPVSQTAPPRERPRRTPAPAAPPPAATEPAESSQTEPPAPPVRRRAGPDQ